MTYVRYGILVVWLLTGLDVRGQGLDTLLTSPPYRLHLRILPGTSPAILFEAGGGQDATQWDSMARVVHQRLGATVITYDRAGFGQSSFTLADYTILREIISLEGALQQLGYGQTALLLVGHSLGGFYNRVYAARHPRQVKGMMLLDPRLPSRADRQFARRYSKGLKRADYEGEYLSLYYLLRRMARTSRYVGRQRLSPGLPILDLMAEYGPFDNPAENEQFKVDQRRFVRRHAQRRLLLVKGSGHNIPQDQPALVIDQLIKFYQLYGGRTPLASMAIEPAAYHVLHP